MQTHIVPVRRWNSCAQVEQKVGINIFFYVSRVIEYKIENYGTSVFV